MQNVLEDEEEWELVVTEDDMAGCPPDVVAAARREAIDRSKGPLDNVLSLRRSFVEAFLSRSSRRDLRRIVYEAFSKRGGGLFQGRDNARIAVEILRLRRRLAGLHGRDSFAEFRFEDTMALTPEAGMRMLDDIWMKGKDAAGREREMLESFLSEDGGDIALEGGIQPWDWRYYAERHRRAKFDFDESEMRTKNAPLPRCVAAAIDWLFWSKYFFGVALSSLGNRTE